MATSLQTTLRFPPQDATNKEIDSSRRQIGSDSYLQFRCRLDSSLPQDIHKEFTGCYNARWRTIYLDEIFVGVHGKVKLLPAFKTDVYTRHDNGDYYYSSDFQVGQKLVLGHSLRDASTGVTKTFIITGVDDSKLKLKTAGYDQVSQNYSESVVRSLGKIRDAFVLRAGGVTHMGIKAIARKFAIIDDDGNRKLSPNEFMKALQENKVTLTSEETDEVLRAFDKNGDGYIAYDEFLQIIRGPMSEGRKQFVLLAFRKLDVNKDGVVTLADLKRHYKGEEMSLEAFLRQFDVQELNGVVTYDEFVDYYNGVSASIDEDAVFAEMMKRGWGL